MDNLNVSQSPKKRKIAIVIIPILVVLLVGLFLYFSGGFGYIKNAIQGLWAAHKYSEFVNNYEKTLTEDAYGGKTPQETLDMFIIALEKGDINLASKYFALDDNLSRKQWEDGLKKAQEEGRINQIIDYLKFAKISKDNSGDATTWFEIYENDKVIKEFSLIFNKYSKVWKIESM